MPVQVTIEISDSDARVLRSWASVGRHFDQTLRLIDTINMGDIVTTDMEQQSIYVEEDIRTLKGPLSNVHSAIREKLVNEGVKPLWDQNQK